MAAHLQQRRPGHPVGRGHRPAGRAAAAVRRLLQCGRIQRGQLPVPGGQPGWHRAGLGDRAAQAALPPVSIRLRTGQSLDRGHEGRIDARSYSPDGRRWVEWTKDGKAWYGSGPDVPPRPIPHPGPVDAARFCDDGSRLVVCGRPGHPCVAPGHRHPGRAGRGGGHADRSALALEHPISSSPPVAAPSRPIRERTRLRRIAPAGPPFPGRDSDRLLG